MVYGLIQREGERCDLNFDCVSRLDRYIKVQLKDYRIMFVIMEDPRRCLVMWKLSQN